MTEQQKQNELTMLINQLAILKEQIDKANAKMKPNFESIDKLNENFAKLRREINEQRITRDKLNEKVKTLKQQRDIARAKIRACVEEVRTNNQKISKLRKEIPQESRQKLQKDLENIEWKIQTTPLDLKEEKRLVEKVRHLEIELKTYKKIDHHIKKIAETKKELKSLASDADVAHQKLAETAKESQEAHSKMMAKISELKSIKAEADILHAAFLQAREKIKPLHEEYRKLATQKKKLQAAIRKEEAKQKKNAEQSLKKRLKSQARKKLQRGEKLNWDEFKILTDSESKVA